MALLPGAICGYPGSIKHLTMKDYAPFFDQYANENQAGFAALALAAALAPDRESFLEDTAQALMASVRQRQQQDRLPVDDLRFTLCLYGIPALRRGTPRIGDRFAVALREAWLQVYPKFPFQLSTYEEIMAGFKPRKLCFITTAACHFAGKTDDCAELTAFRQFRDSYMAAQAPELVQEYYNIAPAIVLAIGLVGDPTAEYNRIWRTELTLCYEALSQGDEAGCMARYAAMVRRLQAQYLGGH